MSDTVVGIGPPGGMERQRQNTAPAFAAPLTTEAAIVQTLASVSRTTEAVGQAVKRGKIGPWVLVGLLVLVLLGVVAAGAFWAAIHANGNDGITDALAEVQKAQAEAKKAREAEQVQAALEKAQAHAAQAAQARRLEALEDAEDARFVHDQWVVQALQALSEHKPLPPYPVPQRRRRLDR